jgi:hypothetical protein
LRDFEEEKQSFSSSKSLKKNIIGWEKRTKDFLHSPKGIILQPLSMKKNSFFPIKRGCKKYYWLRKVRRSFLTASSLKPIVC